MSLLRLPLLVALGASMALACMTPAPSYEHNRYDYWAFRARTGKLSQPNYLPYVTHWEELPDGAQALVLCRWADDAFPLTYFVAPPAIPPELQHEFRPRAAEDYAEAVHRAFARWEEALGRPVRFQPVDDPSRAVLRVRLEASMRPGEEGLVGGMAGVGEDHCRVLGPGPNLDRVEVDYSVHEVTLFIADTVGLLTPRQVHRIALHELGHVLGASGQHSPMGGDVMFRMTDDSRIEALSEHDLNTFHALYRIPAGTVYTRLGESRATPLEEAKRSPPRLDREIVDERFGFALQFPLGWQLIRTPRGWVAVDGLSWDYDASFQVIAVRGTPEPYVYQQVHSHRARGGRVTTGTFELDGQLVTRILVEGEEIAEEVMILGWGEEWVLLLVADCRQRNYTIYQPWFRNVLLSLRRL